MDWETDLNILRNLPIPMPMKGNVLRLLYHIIDEHKGKDFKDLDDLMNQLYPPSVIQPVGTKRWTHRAKRG